MLSNKWTAFLKNLFQVLTTRKRDIATLSISSLSTHIYEVSRFTKLMCSNFEYATKPKIQFTWNFYCNWQVKWATHFKSVLIYNLNDFGKRHFGGECVSVVDDWLSFISIPAVQLHTTTTVTQRSEKNIIVKNYYKKRRVWESSNLSFFSNLILFLFSFFLSSFDHISEMCLVPQCILCSHI